MQIALVAVDIRSTHNVGSFLRTCDGLGIDAVYLTGITPYPARKTTDDRLPHIVAKLQRDIHKTALGAENSVMWHHSPDIKSTLITLKNTGWTICALEQANRSQDLIDYTPPPKLALIVGNEVDGLSAEVLALCDDIVEIPMFGKKESLNVSVAAAIGLYWLKNNWTK